MQSTGPARSRFRRSLLGSYASAFAALACSASDASSFGARKAMADAGHGASPTIVVDAGSEDARAKEPPRGYCDQFELPDGPRPTALGDDSTWAKSFDGWSAVTDLAIDSAGDVAVVGVTLERFVIDGHVVDPPVGVHGYVAKLSRAGAYVFSELLLTSDVESPHLAALPDGSTIVTIGFRGQLEVAGTVYTPPPAQGVAILSFDSHGKNTWTRILPTAMLELTPDVATDSAGNVYVAGSFAPALGDGGTSLVQSVVKLSGDGQVVWEKQIGAPGMQRLRSVAVDSNGAVVVSGIFSDALVIDGLTLQSRGFDNTEIFLAKLDASGAVLWARSVDGRYDTVTHRMGIGPNDELALVGGFSGQMTFDGGVLDGGGVHDYAFALGLDARGGKRWGTSFGDIQSSDAYAVAIGPGGVTAFGGDVWGNVRVGPNTLHSGYIRDAFLATLDGSGTYQSSLLFRSGGVSAVTGIAYGSHGELAVAGAFDCSIDLPLGTLWGVGGSGNAGFVMMSPK